MSKPITALLSRPAAILLCLLAWVPEAERLQLAAQPAENRQQLITLSPSISSMLCLLDAGEQIIGQSAWCRCAPGDAAVVASQMKVFSEKIVRLSPDRVLANELTPGKQLELLRRSGVPVTVLSEPSGFDELCSQLLRLGRITGRERQAERIVRRERSRLDSLRHAIADAPAPGIMVQIGASPIFVAARGTLADSYIRSARAENMVNGSVGGQIGREGVLAEDPDALVLMMERELAAQERRRWQQYGSLQAASEDRIFILDENPASSPSPVDYVDTVEKLIKKLHAID